MYEKVLRLPKMSEGTLGQFGHNILVINLCFGSIKGYKVILLGVRLRSMLQSMCWGHLRIESYMSDQNIN